ncbi:hypothetical protein FIBSPDRAFT_960078 [Athelia psychrophila]|uniref:Uncharacterized protein n=1 Tax=Athelia psychrophila TaxID=1759441 RepID=A0A166CUR2_9AGAM|nr:hypothetical protein FIBSPDRAFT_960078 [Fibularhizoctonia sp. CBS 109695]
MLSDEGPRVPLSVISEINISLAQAIGGSPFPNTVAKVTALHIDPVSSSSHLILLAALHVDLQTRKVSTTQFGEESHGHLTVVKPCFSEKAGEASFVIAGDELGGVSIYNWNAPRPSLGDVARDIPAVPALRNFEGHEDGAVTQIAWNSVTLVTGSARGTISPQAGVSQRCEGKFSWFKKTAVSELVPDDLVPRTTMASLKIWESALEMSVETQDVTPADPKDDQHMRAHNILERNREREMQGVGRRKKDAA